MTWLRTLRFQRHESLCGRGFVPARMGLAEMIKAWKNDGRSTILCGCGRMSWKRIDVPFIRHFVLKMRRKIEVVVWDGIRQIDVVWLVVGGEAGTRK